jgi:hypothetical protein
VDGQDFDLDAAGLRADGADVVTSVEVLAAKLEDALPAQTTVERRSKRLFGGDKVVTAIEVRLGEGRWALQCKGRQVDAAREHEVRGVVIRREPLDLDAWIRGLAAELRRQAETSEKARTALSTLLGT